MKLQYHHFQQLDILFHQLFNVEYLINTLKNLEEDFVSFGFTDPHSACIVKTEADITLIMPVQFKG